MKPVRVELAHRANYGVRRGKIEWIVMHYTANDGDSGMSNARYFQKALNPVASAHYFVDDREIVHLFWRYRKILGFPIRENHARI